MCRKLIELAYVANNENSVPLWEAIKARHPVVAQFLWENNANLNSEEDGELLYNTIQKGDIEGFLQLLKYGAKISFVKQLQNLIKLQYAISKHLPQFIGILGHKGIKLDDFSDSSTQLSLEGLHMLFDKLSPPFNMHSCTKTGEESILNEGHGEGQYEVELLVIPNVEV